MQVRPGDVAAQESVRAALGIGTTAGKVKYNVSLKSHANVIFKVI